MHTFWRRKFIVTVFYCTYDATYFSFDGTTKHNLRKAEGAELKDLWIFFICPTVGQLFLRSNKIKPIPGSSQLRRNRMELDGRSASRTSGVANKGKGYEVPSTVILVLR